MDAPLIVRLIVGVLDAIGLYLSYVGWLAKLGSPSSEGTGTIARK